MLRSRSLVQQTLQHWQADTDLAAIRDVGALAKLPVPERGLADALGGCRGPPETSPRSEALKQVPSPGRPFGNVPAAIRLSMFREFRWRNSQALIPVESKTNSDDGRLPA